LAVHIPLPLECHPFVSDNRWMIEDDEFGTDSDALAEAAAVAIEAARRAGAVLRDWQGRFTIREKRRYDLVTEADLAAQDAVRDFVLQRFPSDRFLGEEGPRADLLDDSRTWVVDPLDGTTNYAHGVPLFATSIALVVRRMPVVGVILDPTRDELFHAVRGQGARLNDRLVTVSAGRSLDEALLSVGFPTQPERHVAMLRSWEHFTTRVQALRRTGSTALNLAYVACGRSEATWSAEAHPWDVAAGALMVREAGGLVTRFNGAPHSFAHLDVVAGNQSVHGLVLEGLRACKVC
jgi:myo-inositol-1(or 4)-monophosphatase